MSRKFGGQWNLDEERRNIYQGGSDMDKKMRTFMKALRLMERAKNELNRYKELRRKAEYLERLMNDWEREMILSLEMMERR